MAFVIFTHDFSENFLPYYTTIFRKVLFANSNHFRYFKNGYYFLFER